MNDLLMLEAALFQLRAVPVDDPQFRLGMSMLENAVAAAKVRVNAARVSDIDFALGDLGNAVEYLGSDEAAEVAPIIDMLRDDVGRLREATALPQELLSSIALLQKKLKARRSAIERQTYQEGGTDEPLPHPPAELQSDALPIRDALSSAGFDTPALDTLIDEPDSLRFHSISAVIDELEIVSA
jgi:hypothetical protein